MRVRAPRVWPTVAMPTWDVKARNAAAGIRMSEVEARHRAGLLRRLGYDQAYAEHRCLGNQAWANEVAGAAPLSEDELAAQVAGAYQR